MSRRRASPVNWPLTVRLLFLALVTFLVVPSTVFADETRGFDVSFPNCGQTLPSSRPDVVIVGVEGGRSFTTNPCLADEFRWAGSSGHHYEVYINTSFPAGSTIHRGDTGPMGTCQSDDRACQAYNYGFNNAEFAFHYAQSRYAVADTWWLDVETANSWSNVPALNARVIQGAVDSLRAHRLLVGIYSIPPMWREIAGNYTISLPKWVVQLRESVATPQYCSATNGFGGGTVALVQIEGATLDRDFACPANPFAEQPSYVALPLTGPRSGELFGTHGGASTFYALPSIGAGAARSVTLDFAPTGADVANALFLTASQSGAELDSVRGTDTPTPGQLRLSFTSRGSEPVIVRIQTFNLENLPPIRYILTPD